MFIARQSLEDAGLEVTLNKNGLTIYGNTPMPDDVHKHIDEITGLMQFTPRDHDRLVEHVASVGIWAALRNCPTEI